MPSVNQNSLRSDFDHLKQQFEALDQQGKVSAELRVVINGLLMLMNVLVSVFLERNTKKGSRNSSIPPSQSDQDDSSVRGSHSKGPSAKHRRFDNSRTETTITRHKVTHCSGCGANLEAVSIQDAERRTRIDIVFEKVIDHVDAEIKCCPHCDTLSKAEFPEGFDGPLQYGSGIKAYAMNLLIAQMVSLSRVQGLLKTLLEITISESVLLKYVLQLHENLAGWENRAIEALLKENVLHVDETSMRVDKHNHWVHVCSGGDIVLKRLHEKRGAEGIDKINIIPRYGGVIVHDCWQSYFNYLESEHALCGSHLLRELTFIVDSNGYQWARNMKSLLREQCQIVSARKRRRLTAKEYANLQKRYRNILTRGAKELPPVPVRPAGKRGRVAQSDAQNLWERMKKHEQAILLFAKRSEVPFTNNRAERDLRMGKVKQKVSGCFRKAEYAHAYCRISSYLQTMKYKGYNPLVALQMAISGEIDSVTV